jgi:hypothetical protein
MPRYFFHVKSGQLTVLDREGVELADIANAVKERRSGPKRSFRKTFCRASQLSAG